MTINQVASDEINFLIYRYLQESGFTHSAFTFGMESNISHSNIKSSLVPPAALMTLLIKGLCYIQAEILIQEDGSVLQFLANESISLIDAVTPDMVLQRRKAIMDRIEEEQRQKAEKEEKEKKLAEQKEKLEKEKSESLKRKREIGQISKENGHLNGNQNGDLLQAGSPISSSGAPGTEDMITDENNPNNINNSTKLEMKPDLNMDPISPLPVDSMKVNNSGLNIKATMSHNTETEQNEDDNEMELNERNSRENSTDLQLSSKILRGHEMEVFICNWSPTEDYLISGSGDSTARIWDLRSHGTGRQIVLKHCLQNLPGNQPDNDTNVRNSDGNEMTDLSMQNKENAQNPANNKDVCTVDWVFDGSKVATGSYDGHARIWSSEGDLNQICSAHEGPIFALKWNKKGDMLVSSGVDKSCVVWDPTVGKALQKFYFHSEPILDVDWQSNDTFASCSTDKEINICRIGENRPIQTFKGHDDEVNAIRWDPQGQLLASCSDDHFMKIWTMQGLAHNIEAHDKEIYSVRWNPAGPGSRNPNAKSKLASASFDKTVKVWDPQTGTCLNHFKEHDGSVYAVNFSPDTSILASGAFDGFCYLFDLRSNKKIGSYKIESGGIYDVSWSSSGHKLAIGGSNAQIAVLDMRRLMAKLN